MTIQAGTKGTYYRDKRPLIPSDGNPAVVLSASGGQVRLEVDNKRTGRKHFADATVAEKMAAGCFVPDAAPAVAAAPKPVSATKASGGKGSSGAGGASLTE